MTTSTLNRKPLQQRIVARRASTRTSISFILICTTVLSGCSLAGDRSEPHRSTPAAEADLAEIPGVTARIARAYNGTTPFLSVNVELTSAFTADEAAFLDQLLAQVWSQDEDSPQKFVTLGVTGAGHTEATTSAALNRLGINSSAYASSSLQLKVADLTTRYGDWPGPIPPITPSPR